MSGFYAVSGECTDANGDVFIVNLTGGVSEFAHGSRKRLRVFQTPTADPVGCAVDPMTGDLAVASLGFGSRGTVAIYKNARSKPTIYRNSGFHEYFYCGYDDEGNLFVDGLASDGSGNFVFAELPKDGTLLKTVTLNQYIGWPGQVEWDGKYMAVGDEITPAIYRFAIRGSHGTRAGTISLGGHAQMVEPFWIQDQTVIVPNAYSRGHGTQLKGHSDILFFNYPGGGEPTTTIKHSDFDPPESAVVSLAPR
ncbi:MAG: hypothetical protein WCC84_08960 [Candidatus Cybelea sp.]